jgi:hypothetical protein
VVRPAVLHPEGFRGQVQEDVLPSRDAIADRSIAKIADDGFNVCRYVRDILEITVLEVVHHGHSRARPHQRGNDI